MFFISEKRSYGKPRHPRQENWHGRLFIFKMSERFEDVGSVDNFIAEQEKKKPHYKNRSCVGFDLLLFHPVGVLVLNVSIRELKWQFDDN